MKHAEVFMQKCPYGFSLPSMCSFEIKDKEVSASSIVSRLTMQWEGVDLFGPVLFFTCSCFLYNPIYKINLLLYLSHFFYLQYFYIILESFYPLHILKAEEKSGRGQ